MPRNMSAIAKEKKKSFFSAFSAPLREKNISGAILFLAVVIVVIHSLPLRAFSVNGFQANRMFLQFPAQTGNTGSRRGTEFAELEFGILFANS